MLKLTLANPFDVAHPFVYIRASQVVAICANEGGSAIDLATRGYASVTETPEQIMAMPEMLEASHPLYLYCATPFGTGTESSDYNPGHFPAR